MQTSKDSAFLFFVVYDQDFFILIGKEMNECYSTSILNVFSTEVG